MARLGWILTTSSICLFAAALLTGCDSNMPWLRTKGEGSRSLEPVPEPLDLLLPHKLEFSGFTKTTSFDDENTGILVNIKALDAYGHEVKAFGDFRFELYSYVPYQQNHKGTRLATWEVSISDPKQNMKHWKDMFHLYEFRLGGQDFPTGHKLILVATFTSRFTHRLTTEKELTAGASN